MRLFWGRVQNVHRRWLRPESEQLLGACWGLRARQHGLELWGIYTPGNLDISLWVYTYTGGQCYRRLMGFVPPGIAVQITLRQHEQGHVCLSVHRASKMVGCAWHRVPKHRLPIGFLSL